LNIKETIILTGDFLKKVYVVFDPVSNCHKVEHLDLNNPEDLKYIQERGISSYAMYEVETEAEAEKLVRELEAVRR